MSKTYKVIFSSEAVNDLQNIYAYIAYELLEPDTAGRQVERIMEKVNSLETMPGKYAVVDWEPMRSRNVHRVPVDNYLVFYKVDSGQKLVTIARIFYGGQNIEDNY